MNEMSQRWGLMMEVARGVAMRQGARAARELRERWAAEHDRQLAAAVGRGATEEREVRIEG